MKNRKLLILPFIALLFSPLIFLALFYIFPFLGHPPRLPSLPDKIGNVFVFEDRSIYIIEPEDRIKILDDQNNGHTPILLPYPNRMIESRISPGSIVIWAPHRLSVYCCNERAAAKAYGVIYAKIHQGESPNSNWMDIIQAELHNSGLKNTSIYDIKSPSLRIKEEVKNTGAESKD